MIFSQVAQAASDLASMAAVIAAGIWFIYTTRFKQRLQFDIDCRFVHLVGNPRSMLVEVQFILENKGFVEHRLWDLTVSVHALEAEGRLDAKPKTNEVTFATRLLSKIELVPQHYEYYFVRPGVRQVITHIIEIPANISVLRVTSGFLYERDNAYPHTARRIFAVPRTSPGGPEVGSAHAANRSPP